MNKKQIVFALLTFTIYACIIGWPAAIVLIGAIAFHESSHLWAARKMGLETKGFYLMPFIGGAAIIAGEYKTQSQKAFVVLAGPVGGGLLALATAIAYLLTGWHFLAAAATLQCYLNLFNLLPLSILDGGQLLETITQSINKTLAMVTGVLSFLAALVVIFKLSIPLGCFVAVLGGLNIAVLVRNWWNYRQDKFYLVDQSYLLPPTKLRPGQIVQVIGGWAFTAAILGLAYKLLQKAPHSSIESLFR